MSDADLVLTDTGHIIATRELPAYLAHPANCGRVVRVVPLRPRGGDDPTFMGGK